MLLVHFEVPTIPIAQLRPRAVNAGGRILVVGNPAKHPVNDYKATCRLVASQHHNGAPIDGPLALQIEFILPRPKRLIWKERSMPRAHHDRRPDLDNLLKSTIDALTGLLWRDDNQIQDLHSLKWYAAGDEQPHVEVTVRRTTNT